MREQLIKYIDLLFAGARDAEDMKQEILQNTLDRYDDLITQGKTPESAYSLAISGIGDISEILSGNTPAPAKPETKNFNNERSNRNARLCRAAAIIFFILCPIPVILLESVVGVCLLLAMVAAGVGLLVFFGKEEPEKKEVDHRSPLHKSLHGITWGCGLALYFFLSFSTGAWYITWMIFPVIGFLCGVINAVFDLNKHFLNALVRIVIFGILASIFALILFGYSAYVTVFDGFWEDIFIQSTPVQGGTASSSGAVPAEAVKNLQIQWDSGSITVVPGDVKDIGFSESGNFTEKDIMVWKQDGNSLIIQFKKRSFVHFGSMISPSKDLTVTVPRDWICNELEIDSVSADVQVTGLRASEMELVNVSGACEFTDCDVTDFSAETVSGSVRYQGGLQQLDFDTVSANCVAVLSANPRQIDMDTVSGDLELVLPDGCGFTLELDSVSGNFTSDFATTVSNHRHISGDGACDISADSVSGNIRIHKP